MASREQHYTHLPCARTRLNTSQFKSLPLLHMYLHIPSTTWASLFLWIHRTKEPWYFLLCWPIFHIYVCVCAAESHCTDQLLIILLVCYSSSWQQKVRDRCGAAKRASGAWVPTLRISSGACVCSGTATFRAGHWGSPQLCKDERIKCWDRRAQRNGRR